MHIKLHNTEEGHLSKIFFPLNPNDWHEYNSESLWVKRIKGNHYLVKNVPFYLKNISLYDIVSAKKNDEDELCFLSVIKRGGHSTYRIVLDSPVNVDLFEKYWKLLEKQGCIYEKATTNFYSIDVPPYSDIYDVYDLLEKGERDSIWEFEEGYFGHLLKRDKK